MTVTTQSTYRCTPSPLHAIFLAGTVPLFLGGLLSDIAYFQTYQIQWANFAAWLNAGGLVFCGFALLFALVNLIRAEHKGGRPVVYFLLLLSLGCSAWSMRSSTLKTLGPPCHPAWCCPLL